MELKDFIHKTVIHVQTGKRYFLCNITAPVIEVVDKEPDKEGKRFRYRLDTINGDPISNGSFVFEDPTLTEPFKTAYNAHCRSEDGYWEEYGYWMRKD